MEIPKLLNNAEKLIDISRRLEKATTELSAMALIAKVDENADCVVNKKSQLLSYIRKLYNELHLQIRAEFLDN